MSTASKPKSTRTTPRTSTAAKEFQALKKFFPKVIAGMKGPTFTSHEFILELGQNHQKEYVQALCRYSENDAPFMTLHGQISNAIGTFPELVERGPDVKSKDIFGQKSECASWHKKA
jgi:hypothetical protein